MEIGGGVRDSTSGTVKAEIIHNFGRSDLLDRDQLVRLCKSIARVCQLQVCDPLCDDESDSSGSKDALPHDVVQIETRAFGILYVIETLWERLGIGTILRQVVQQHGCCVPYERALFAMTANRLCDPQSKLGVWDRWLQRVYLPSCQSLKLAQMYEAMDLLTQYAEQVEKTVFFQIADLLNLQVDLIFYDTTTCSFCIDDTDELDDSELRQRGHAKEGGWAPQVVVALAVTREGLPVRSWVLPGNTADVTTVQQVKNDLRGWKLGRALFVADAGMNSEDNRIELLRGCGRYLLATRMASVKEIKENVLSAPGRYKLISDNLRVKEVTIGEGELRRRYILCYNPHQAEREALHRATVVQQLKTELDSHPDRDSRAKWAIKLQASGRYGSYLTTDVSGQLVLDHQAIRKAARFDGRWVLITNDDTISLQDAATSYKSLLTIEQCFHTLKRTQMQLTPMHHWLPTRITAHVKICVLALLIARVAERATGMSWARIAQQLDRLQATEYATEAKTFFQTNQPPADCIELLKKLDISLPKRVLAVLDRT